jgi:WD40 repeat protein
MKVMADGKKVLVGDYDGHLKLISLRDGKLIKDFLRPHHNYITGIMVTLDQLFFFTSSDDGVLKQWNYGDKSLVTDHGRITNCIESLFS